MNPEQTSNTFLQNEWLFILLSFLVLVALFFIQKYAYLLDRKLNQASKIESTWEGKPWPLFAGIGLGLFWFLYNMFSPNDLSLDFEMQNPVKWVFIVIILAGLAGVIYESLTHFSLRTGLIRTLIYYILVMLYFYAGFISGLFIVSVIALVLVILVFRYFINLFK